MLKVVHTETPCPLELLDKQVYSKLSWTFGVERLMTLKPSLKPTFGINLQENIAR